MPFFLRRRFSRLAGGPRRRPCFLARAGTPLTPRAPAALSCSDMLTPRPSRVPHPRYVPFRLPPPPPSPGSPPPCSGTSDLAFPCEIARWVLLGRFPRPWLVHRPTLGAGGGRKLNSAIHCLLLQAVAATPLTVEGTRIYGPGPAPSWRGHQLRGQPEWGGLAQ